MTLIVKIGGAAGIGGDALLDDLAALARRRDDLVLVHGGSDETTRLQQALGKPARFVTSPSGQQSRVCERDDLEAFLMATALVNRRLVEGLTARGLRPMGLSGADGGLVRGQRKSRVRAVQDGRQRVLRDQWTGRPERVDTELLERLQQGGLLPVLAPVCSDDSGDLFNVDGDRLAARLAQDTGAETLVILTNVPGLLEDPARPETLVAHVPSERMDDAAALAKGRMAKKILAAREALAGGVARVILADARSEHPLADALAGRGTVLGQPLADATNNAAPANAANAANAADTANAPDAPDAANAADAAALADPTSFDAGFSGHRGLTLVRGEGSHVWDANGRRYLDATSMFGVASLGHAHPALARALCDQSRRLVSCFASFANDQRASLLRRLTQLLAPLDRVFLCNSGTEAVEAAIKTARRVTGRHGVVALTGAFHGRTMGALSATWRRSHRETFEPLLDGFAHVRPGDIEALDAALHADVGLLLLEIVQGEGGVRALDPGYLRAARRMCRERGILFAVDEVQTGVGRTGDFCAYQGVAGPADATSDDSQARVPHIQHLDPDMVCLAKGLGGGVPIGALAFRSSQVPRQIGTHGSTFGGNPLACAAALAVLDTLERDGLTARTAEHGERLRRWLRQRLRPGAGSPVRDVRGLGLVIGVELRDAAAPVLKRLQQRGVLVLGAGPRVVRLLPPLTCSWADLQRLGEALVQEIMGADSSRAPAHDAPADISGEQVLS